MMTMRGRKKMSMIMIMVMIMVMVMMMEMMISGWQRRIGAWGSAAQGGGKCG